MIDLIKSVGNQVRHYFQQDTCTLEVENNKAVLKRIDPIITITIDPQVRLKEELPMSHLSSLPHCFSSGYPNLFLTVLEERLQQSGMLVAYSVENPSAIAVKVSKHTQGTTVLLFEWDAEGEDFLDNQEDMIAAIEHREEFFDTLKELMEERPKLIDPLVNNIIGNLMRDLPPALFVDRRVRCSEGQHGSIVIDYNVNSRKVGIRISDEAVDGERYYAKERDHIKHSNRLRRAMRALFTPMHKTRNPVVLHVFYEDIVSRCILGFNHILFDYKETER